MVKVIFIGGFAYGKVAYEYLRMNRYVSLEMCITYPDSSCKAETDRFNDGEKIIKDISANKYLAQIKSIEPDFIFVNGWSELLSMELVNSAKQGTIGFHPSKLPADRGRSVLAWQIEEGYRETALSMFYMNGTPDCGDIVAQEKIVIESNDTVSDVLRKVGDATYNLMKAYFPLLREGKAPRMPQDLNRGNFRRLRTDRDSLIDWNRSSETIYNKVRAITFPYPGAIAFINNEKYRVWKCDIVKFPIARDLAPGSLAATVYDQSLIMKTGDGFVRLMTYEKIL